MSGEGRGALLAILLAASPAAALAESLTDAILLAYQTNPTQRAQRAQLRAIDEGLVQARAGYGPQVGITGQAGYDVARIEQPGSPFSPAADKTYRAQTESADLSIVQPLYSGGATRAQIQAASADVLAGRANLRRAESDLIVRVITAYLDLRRDRETIRVLKDEIANLTAEFDETKAKGEGGQLTRTDVAETLGRMLSAQAELNLAEGRLNVSNAQYLAVVGQSPGALDPEPELAGLPRTVEEAFDAAERNNPQLMAAIATERSARQRIAQAKAAFGPTLSVRVDATVTPAAAYLEKQYARSLTGAVTFSQPLFTSGLTNSRVREAADRDSQAQLEIEATRRGVIQQVAQAWSQLVSTRGALAIEVRQVEAERASVEGNRIEERAGLRSTIELLNAELELTTSRVTLVQGRHDEYLARASVLAAMGLLEARFLVPGVEAYDTRSDLDRAKRIDAPPWEAVVGAVDSLGAAAPGRPMAKQEGGSRPSDLPPLPQSQKP